MHFELTDEQQMIQQAAREFAQSEIVPVAAKFDRQPPSPGTRRRPQGAGGDG